MTLTNQLDIILGQASKVKILRHLARTGLEQNGREIASAIGLSHVNVHTALKELGKHGVVTVRGQGRSILYCLNNDNILVKNLILPLFKNEIHLENELSKILKRYLKILVKSVILYGSFATDSARPDSDIDILVVPQKKYNSKVLEKALMKAEMSITTGFGNRLAPIVMDSNEFRRRFKSDDGFVKGIVKNGKILLGNSINELIIPND